MYAHRFFYGSLVKAMLSDEELAALLTATLDRNAAEPWGTNVQTLATKALLEHGGWMPVVRQHLTITWDHAGRMGGSVAWFEVRTYLIPAGTPAEPQFLQFLLSMVDTIDVAETAVELDKVIAQVPRPASVTAGRLLPPGGGKGHADGSRGHRAEK
jgi:hypothetical protein